MNTETSPRMWGHITLPDNAVLTRRDQVRVGDTVISSHSGRRTVERVDVRGDEGQTTYLTLQGLTHHGPEAYPSDSLIPVILDPVTELLRTASPSALIDSIIRLTHSIHASDTARVEELDRTADLRRQRQMVRDELLRRTEQTS